MLDSNYQLIASNGLSTAISQQLISVSTSSIDAPNVSMLDTSIDKSEEAIAAVLLRLSASEGEERQPSELAKGEFVHEGLDTSSTQAKGENVCTTLASEC